MATLKEFRNMVWQHEFDIADQETNLRAQRIERVRAAPRQSAHRGLPPAARCLRRLRRRTPGNWAQSPPTSRT